MPNPDPLPHRRYGKGGTPLVLIHGFGADRLTWSSLAKALAADREVIALDLPGHGAAVDWEGTPDAGVCAKAVLASLDTLGIERAVLVGHSLGGAVASLVALRAPQRVERLILLAPGGFGREMNAALLRRYAAITREDEARAVLAEFFGTASQMPAALPRQTAEQRAKPGVAEKLGAIVEAIARGDGQGTLPLAELMAGGVPVTLVWGHEDRVLPVAQAIDAPPEIARHLVRGVGHMPHLEVPELVLRVIGDALGPPETAA
ncbi:alpha/beta fold hydrolase [Acuticoccus sp. I52.16.1]|uniref:alpha/beta fold hydrolase n=1 Tax=Acuticoccus sp. I52.16.1 TaxID=2928472 RepID=UPI001FD0AF9B|nr:alpha/beta fold hydrolase [Acuticoccus sp. I52.16.1]UOM32948.1 alpha/beta fold hydrolase [Acuticoccus sp. I52.16.1]